MELCLRKHNNGLYPVRDEDQDWMSRCGNDEHFLGKIKQVRNPKFFRKWFALVQFAFDHWDTPVNLECKYGYVEKNFDSFRKNIIVLAGFYDVVHSITGEFRLAAKSIAWHNMEEGEFHPLYNATFNAISKHIFNNYTAEQLKDIEKALERFI